MTGCKRRVNACQVDEVACRSRCPDDQDRRACARRLSPRLGPKVRALRRRESLSQVQLAERLGISPSYLNLIESNRRPLPAALLIKLAQLFGVDLHAFGADDDARLVSDLLEAFSDPLFDALPAHVHRPARPGRQPPAGRARGHRALQLVQGAARGERGARVAPRGRGGRRASDRSLLPSEEVNDLIQQHDELLPRARGGRRGALEEGAPRRRGALRRASSATSTSSTASTCASRAGEAERGVLRRFDAEKKLLTLSELLPTRSRTFQLAHQIALLTQHARIDRLVADAHLTTRRVARARARGARELLRRRRAHAVRAVPRGVPRRSATTSTSSAGASASASSRSATASRRCGARARRACRST